MVISDYGTLHKNLCKSREDSRKSSLHDRVVKPLRGFGHESFSKVGNKVQSEAMLSIFNSMCKPKPYDNYLQLPTFHIKRYSKVRSPFMYFTTSRTVCKCYVDCMQILREL